MPKTKVDPIANLDKIPTKPVIVEEPSCVRKYVVTPGVERYFLKLKDKFGHQGMKISGPLGRNISLRELRVSKIQGENNAVVIELLKAL